MNFLLLQVITPHYHQEDALKNMHELEQLVGTFGGQVVEKSIQHRVHPHPSTYVGTGKVQWLKEKVAALDINVVVINGIAKSGQLFRLEKELWEIRPQIQVWDRVDLILNIFERHAVSKEAQLQIELARITHMGPRVYGLGGSVLSRQGGGIGTRGKGETNIEIEKRVMKQRIQNIRQQLKHLSKTKQARLRYREEQGIGPVALVGYTSAGKTSVFNRLTGKDKLSDASLFTTLDTVVGKLKVPESRMPILISDTIGFIQDLPPALIEAFQSTLMESMEAKVLLHVIDAGDPDMERKLQVVNQVLTDLKLTQPRVIVFNKVDQLPQVNKASFIGGLGDLLTVFVSAKTNQGIDDLKQIIVNMLIDTKKSEIS